MGQIFNEKNGFDDLDAIDQSLLPYYCLLLVYLELHKLTGNIPDGGEEEQQKILQSVVSYVPPSRIRTDIIARFPATVKYLRENKDFFCFNRPEIGKNSWLAKLSAQFKVAPIPEEDWHFAATALLKFLPSAVCMAASGHSLDGTLANAFTQLATEIKSHGRATVPPPVGWEHISPDIRIAAVAHMFVSKVDGGHPHRDIRPFEEILKKK